MLFNRHPDEVEQYCSSSARSSDAVRACAITDAIALLSCYPIQGEAGRVGRQYHRAVGSDGSKAARLDDARRDGFVYERYGLECRKVDVARFSIGCGNFRYKAAKWRDLTRMKSPWWYCQALTLTQSHLRGIEAIRLQQTAWANSNHELKLRCSRGCVVFSP